MAAQNLAKRVATEIKRGGKKSIALGLLVLFGLYFWLPMFGKGSGSNSKSSSAAPTNAKTPKQQPTPIAGPDPSPQTTRSDVDWKTLRARLNDSTVLGPVAMDERARDPFERDWIREKVPKIEPNKDADGPDSPDPSKSLVCSSILVGPSIRLAVIGDDTCQVGDKIPSKGPVQYRIKEILEDRVVLERDGDEVTLHLKESKANPSKTQVQ